MSGDDDLFGFREVQKPRRRALTTGRDERPLTPRHNVLQARFENAAFRGALALMAVGMAGLCRMAKAIWEDEHFRLTEGWKRAQAHVEGIETTINNYREPYDKWVTQHIETLRRDLQNQQKKLISQQEKYRAFCARHRSAVLLTEHEYERKNVDVCMRAWLQEPGVARALSTAWEQAIYGSRYPSTSVIPDGLDGDGLLRLRIELKPVLGDDFPAALRQARKNYCSVLLYEQWDGTSVTEEVMQSMFRTAGVTAVRTARVEAQCESAAGWLQQGGLFRFNPAGEVEHARSQLPAP